VWRVLGGAPPDSFAAGEDSGPLLLRHPAVLPTLIQLVAAGLADGTGCIALVDQTLEFVGGLVAYEANGVAACEAGLLSTVLESFRDALADTSHAQHDQAVWLTRTLGAQKMSGREVRQYFSLMNNQGSVAGLVQPLQVTRPPTHPLSLSPCSICLVQPLQVTRPPTHPLSLSPCSI
jgi:hypothetical protein